MWKTGLFPTQLVGSWVKPKWVADHGKVYAKEGTWWSIPEAERAEAIAEARRELGAAREGEGEEKGSHGAKPSRAARPSQCRQALVTRAGGA